ncbi:MAG: prolipoprotein diacylglyceryl transferase family protein [Anaerolineae bacterium]
MAPTVRFFGLTAQSYALTLLLAVWVGLWLSAREARRLGVDENLVYNLGFYSLLAALLGARLAYVLGHWTAYQDAPLSALSLTPTALAWPEGALIGGVVAIVYWSRRRLPVGTTMDAIAPGLALALALERLGAFLDGRGFGEPTTLPWGVYLWDEVRHPVQLYEAAVLLIVLGVLWRRRERRPFDKLRAGSFDGYSFALFAILYAGSRLFLEAFRAETSLMANGIRTVQVVALGGMLSTVGYLYRRRFPATEGTPGGEPSSLGEASPGDNVHNAVH